MITTEFEKSSIRSQFCVVIILLLQIFIKRKEIIAKIKKLKNWCRYTPEITSLENDQDQQLQQISEVSLD